MKYRILLLATPLLASFSLTAQHAAKTYAITGKANNNFFWADIKQVDIRTGKVNKTLFEAEKTPFKITNPEKTPVAAKGVDKPNPTGLGVAACALDTRHNRLYFATMHFSDIRYLDLSAPGASFTTIKSKILPDVPNQEYQPEENHLTRMVIAADGFGYALSNDFNHLIRFNTSTNSEVVDLENIVDGENNKGISIHNKCTSWGGDMVADAFGNLVIVSAAHQVFFVDINTRIASLKGEITGLPQNFTTNGAAVDDDGDLVVSSANVFEGLFKVNAKTLAAVKISGNEPAFNASDLANGNLLRQKEADEIARYAITRPVTMAADAKLFPNPVKGAEFNVLFENQPAGRYTIILTDMAGQALQTKTVTVFKSGQVENVRINRKNAGGLYLVKVLNEDRKLSFSEKLIVNH